MKYTFEVITHENENIIKVDIISNGSFNTVTRTINFIGGSDYDAPNLDELISDMVDNIRLTVKEREEATYNAEILKWYLQQYKVNANKVKQQMIVEESKEIVNE